MSYNLPNTGFAGKMVQVTKGLSYLLHLVPGLYSRIFMLMSTNEELTGLQITQPEVWKRGDVERLAFSEKENEIFGKCFPHCPQ